LATTHQEHGFRTHASELRNGIIWQRYWNYPFAQLIINTRQGPRDVMVSPLPYLWQQAQMIGFVSVVLRRRKKVASSHLAFSLVITRRNRPRSGLHRGTQGLYARTIACSL